MSRYGRVRRGLRRDGFSGLVGSVSDSGGTIRVDVGPVGDGLEGDVVRWRPAIAELATVWPASLRVLGGCGGLVDP